MCRCGPSDKLQLTYIWYECLWMSVLLLAISVCKTQTHGRHEYADGRNVHKRSIRPYWERCFPSLFLFVLRGCTCACSHLTGVMATTKSPALPSVSGTASDCLHSSTPYACSLSDQHLYEFSLETLFAYLRAQNTSATQLNHIKTEGQNVTVYSPEWMQRHFLRMYLCTVSANKIDLLHDTHLKSKNVSEYSPRTVSGIVRIVLLYMIRVSRNGYVVTSSGSSENRFRERSMGG